MTSQKKISIALAILTGLLLIILLITHYLASRIINIESIKSNLQTIISREVGGKIEYQTARLSLLPFPHAVIHKVLISIPNKFEGTIDTLSLHPRIFPLLTGKLQIKKIYLESPVIKIKHPILRSNKEKTEPVTARIIKDILTETIVPLASGLPKLSINIKDGRFDIAGENNSFFIFDNVHAKVRTGPERIKIRINCRSSLSSDISINASLNINNLTGKGEIKLEDFQPQTLFEYLLQNDAYRITEPINELTLNFHINGPDDFRVELNSALPDIKLHTGKEESVIRGKSLNGKFHSGKDKAILSLSKLDLNYPHLEMTGEFLFDNKTGQQSLEFEAKNVDIDSTRHETLALAGDNALVKRIFDIIRAGTIPSLKFSSKGKSLADLNDTKNFVIRGSIRNGNIFVPGPDLDLQNVQGDVVVKQGILEGSDIDSTLETAEGRSGKIRIGLEGEDAPLYVETEVTTDPAIVPPILNRLINDKTFLSEINRIDNIKGLIKGKLVIGDSFDSIKVEVDIDKINLSADYDRVPYPLTITSGQFHYDASKINLNNLNMYLGSSPVTGLTATIGLENDNLVEIQSGESSILVDEIYPWLSSYQKIGSALESFKSANGIVNLSEINLNGPLFSPENWIFNLSGELKDLVMTTALFPWPVEITEGSFSTDENTLSLTDARVNTMDGSIRLTGSINNYLSDPARIELTFHGEIGEEAAIWISEFIDLPEELRVRPPVSVSEAHLIWENNDSSSFDGKFRFNKGPEISLNLDHDPERLRINNLFIDDDKSHAQISFALNDRELFLNFSGNLTQATATKLLLNSSAYKGWIKGNFRADILLDQPHNSTVHGMIEAEDFQFPGKLNTPLIIDKLSAHAQEKQVVIDFMNFTWSEHLSLKGFIRTSGEEFVFNMNMSANELDWNRIEKILGIDKEDLEEKEYFWDLPVKGTLRLNSERFRYKQYIWSPLQANISFNRSSITADITEANLCGISFPGILKLYPNDTSLDFQLLGRNQELETTLLCFEDNKGITTGKFDFNADIKMERTNKDLIKAVHGDFHSIAKDGRIHRYGFIAKIFRFLNLTETFMGRFPDIAMEGFPYNSIIASGNIKDGMLVLKEYIIDSPSMQITGQGDINLIEKKVDLKFLVAPLKTIDFFVSKIPVVSSILGGTLISIPVSVKGDLDDPNISFLSPSDIGAGLFEIMKNTIKAPFKILEPILPNNKEN